jgi:multiple sugar transport system ATP-binding protein
MAEIVLEGVVKQYPNGAFGLKKTDLTIRDGEFFILVGPSGCGKSTLLNLIVGLEEVSEGSIRVDARKVNEIDPKDRNMAMVFQSYALYPHLSVRENIAFPLKLARRPKNEIQERVNNAAEILQLTELLDLKPHMLSGGQRQRVAMGRAIVRHPAVFLMDEPLSNLDARLRVQMRTEIARLQRRLGITTVYVTHDQTEAMTLGHRVAVLKDGEIQQVGTPRELYQKPANVFVAGFIGSPGMNFVPAAIHDGCIALPFAEVALPEGFRGVLPQQRSGWIAGLRPEDLQQSSAVRSEPAASVAFPFTAEVLEWLGAEVFVHGEAHGRTPTRDPAQADTSVDQATGSVRLTARLEPDTCIREGETLELCFDPRRLHLFDAATGERLGE